jgi:hypothetical protein
MVDQAGKGEVKFSAVLSQNLQPLAIVIKDYGADKFPLLNIFNYFSLIIHCICLKDRV